MKTTIKTLYLDIEVSPNEAYVFGNRARFIPAKNMKETSRMLCYAYSWHGERELRFRSEWDGIKEHFIDELWRVMDEADAIISYNGERFDIKVVNKEFLLHGVTPPMPTFSIDLFKTVRKKFKFTHSSLQSVAQELGIGKKIPHTGIDLWVDTMNGDDKARRLMERYNKQDVRLLKPLYQRLLPWIDQHPNLNLYVDSSNPICPRCGSSHIHKHGVERTNVAVYQRYRCNSCGAPSRGRTTMVPADDKQRIIAAVRT